MEFEIVELEKRHTAVIRDKTPMAQISAHFMSAMPEVAQAVQEAGAEMAGPPFGRYFAHSAEEVDLEVGIPVAEPFTATGRATPSEIPGGRHITAIHTGPYQDLPGAHRELIAYTVDNGHKAIGPTWESYITDPGDEPDSSKWQTMLGVPID